MIRKFKSTMKYYSDILTSINIHSKTSSIKSTNQIKILEDIKKTNQSSKSFLEQIAFIGNTDTNSIFVDISMKISEKTLILKINTFDKVSLLNCILYFGNHEICGLKYDGKIYYANIDIETLELSDLHNAIYIKKKDIKVRLAHYVANLSSYPVVMDRDFFNDSVIALRTTAGTSNLMLSYINFYEGVKKEDEEKFLLLFGKERQNKYILFFEKRSESFGESAFYLFDKMYKNNEDILFILSALNPDFEKLKKKYGDQLIEKNSTRYYEVVYNAKLLVSSELPNHILAVRTINYKMVEHIYSIPYVFLQHGIMFAKPITNPMANGFWKENIKYNLVKTVVSSKLEMTEFYKVGYNRNDLILTGLPKMDSKKIDAKKEYIVYMPTYRFWEEFNIYNGKIEETTYYKDILEVINICKKIGVLDKLKIVPHPKFASFITSNNSDLGILFDKNYTEIQDNILIFITDFSSASFDAHFSGSYIIYLWNRRKELERHYKAKSPLNIHTCDGVPLYSIEDLGFEIQYAASKEYIMDQLYEDRFSKIIEHKDQQNCERCEKEIYLLLEEIDEYIR